MIKAAFYGTEGLEDIQPPTLIQYLNLLGWIASLVGYYYICWRKQGQTMGMKAWRLRLQQIDGDLASPAQCLKRCFFACLSLAVFGLGYLYCLIPSKKDCAHDIFTQTKVVVLEKS
jgi:uncharacterized RDD family membrane protein YckC